MFTKLKTAYNLLQKEGFRILLETTVLKIMHRLGFETEIQRTRLRIGEFLKEFQVEEIDPLELEISMGLPPLLNNEERVKRTEGLKDLIDDIIDKHKDLKEFEDELEKHKDKITPVQVGESYND